MYGREGWMNAKAMRARGMSFSEIGRALGLDRRTAKKLCLAEEPPIPKSREKPSVLDSYKDIIDAWLERRPKMGATQICAQLTPLGYAGSYPTVKRYVATRKEDMVRRATVRFEIVPGFQAQADFGKLRVRFLSGEVSKVVFFAFQMGFSRYRAVSLCPDETQDTLIACMTAHSPISAVYPRSSCWTT